MDQVDTLHVYRYWSQVLGCTIMTHLYDLDVKFVDFFYVKFYVKVLFKLFISLYVLILCMFVDISLKFYAVPS